MSNRPFDVVLYGATGFTGKQTAHYFDQRAPEGLKWAIAGRNAAKLQAVAAELSSDPAILVADALDREAVSQVASQTRVLLTTAGPFALYGDVVAEQCVAHETHYVDITGETPWAASLIERFHDRAAASGTRIIPFSGFDSIPSDLGAYMMISWIRQNWGIGTRSVVATFKASGGLNGGTLASALTIAEQGDQRTMANTLLLNPPELQTAEEARRSRDFKTVQWDDELGVWLTPFFMASVNTRVVRRSNALFSQYGQPYGPEFRYQEMLETRSRRGAWLMALGMGAGFKALQRPLVRRLVRRFGPSPGEGPTDEVMDNGFFKTRLRAVADDGRTVAGTVYTQGDPGNRATVLMLCESALALALTPPSELPGGAERGGILTPATGLGDVLLNRLRAAGMTWTVEA